MRNDGGFGSVERSAERGFTSFGRSAEHGFTSFGRSAEHGFTSFERSAEHGFTLIEVMVALAVFSLAVLALVRLEGAAVRGAALVDEATVAQIVARNVALDAMTDAAVPAPGRTDGGEVNGGRSWRWTQQVSPTGDPRVVRIDVAVANRAGQVVGRLTVVRPPTAAAVPVAAS